MIDINKLTPQQLDRYIHLQAFIDRQATAAAKVRSGRDYYNGEHPVLLTQRQQEFLGPQLTEGEYPFAHNLVRSVIDTLRERISVTGFTVNGASAGEDTPEAQMAASLWQWWNASQMDADQVDLYVNALRDGRGYVIVDFDNERGMPRFTVHEVDDGRVGVMLHRDPASRKRTLFASLYWTTFDPLTPGATGIQRKTVYLDGTIRKYQQAGTATPMGSGVGWTGVLDEDDLAWPLAWADRRGRPLGVPVFEFANPGGSEIDAVAGLQNLLNKTWLDLIAAADMAGFPILTGNYRDAAPDPTLTEDDDDIEDADEFIIAPGRYLEIFGGEIRRIEGADLGNLTKLIWDIVSAISGVTRTPHQYLRPFLTADVPSGEALKQLEAGLVAKAIERQKRFSSAWSDAARMALRVANTFGSGPDVPDDVQIDVQWADANTRMAKAEAEIAQIFKGLELPNEVIWEKAGMTPEQIAQFKDAVRRDRMTEIAAIAGAVQVAQTRNAPQTNPQANGAA